MFRKVLTASVLGLVLAGTVISIPADASSKISNGVHCTKANQKVKVNGYLYKCTHSPTITHKKLTWVSTDCISANSTYLKLKKSYTALVADLPANLAALDTQIAAAKQKGIDSNAKADGLDAQVVTWQAKLAEFTAAKAALVADTAHATANASTINTYSTAIRSLNSAIASNTAASHALRKIGGTVTNMEAQRATTVSSVDQAKSEVAQALSMRKLTCQRGL